MARHSHALTLERRYVMKNFLFGLVTGIILASTGTYAVIKETAKKAATKENAEKVVKATQEFGGAIKDIFD